LNHRIKNKQTVCLTDPSDAFQISTAEKLDGEKPGLRRAHGTRKWIINPERPRADLKSQIRSQRVTVSSKHRLP